MRSRPRLVAVSTAEGEMKCSVGAGGTRAEDQGLPRKHLLRTITEPVDERGPDVAGSLGRALQAWRPTYPSAGPGSAGNLAGRFACNPSRRV